MNEKTLIMQTDGGSRGNPGPSACGVYFPETGERIGAYAGECTNNVAEYLALILGLKYARETGHESVDVYADSLLMVKQVNGEYRVNAPTILPLYREVGCLLGRFSAWSIHYIPREMNKEADAICNQIMDRRENGEEFECLERLKIP